MWASIFRNASSHLWLNQHDIRFGENMWWAVIQERAAGIHRDTPSANCGGGLICRLPSCLCGLPNQNCLVSVSFTNIIGSMLCHTKIKNMLLLKGSVDYSIITDCCPALPQLMIRSISWRALCARVQHHLQEFALYANNHRSPMFFEHHNTSWTQDKSTMSAAGSTDPVAASQLTLIIFAK